jgi:uncharacterized protein YjaZ
MTWVVVHNRFTVNASADAISVAAGAHVNLRDLVQRTLMAVDQRLPGPAATIQITHNHAVIHQVGTNGYTYPNGLVTVQFDRVTLVSIEQTLTFWLPRAIAHELNHSVRITAGPGYGATLLDSMVSEGLADNFDTSVFPGPTQPWDNALTSDQAAALWQHAKGSLADSDPSTRRAWLFGGGNIPVWTGYTLGFRLVAGYLQRHPGIDGAAATRLTADEIQAGSGM